MERTCTYKQLIVILLALSKLAVTGTKEFYCTSEGSWKKAMSTCLDFDGKPMSYRDIADAADVKLKQGTTVWTADYGYWEIVDSVSQLTNDYECGYMRFNSERLSFLNRYTPTTSVEYDACSNTRLYFCENGESTPIGMYGPDTWLQAYQSCKSPNKLWSGYDFFSVLGEEHLLLWVKSARKFTRDTLKDTIPTSKHLVRCGTSEAPVNREEGDNCEQRFQAVCILETRTDDIRLSRSCLREKPTTTSTTTITTPKPTLKPTRPTTQFKTTVKRPQQSTKTFNGTTSQSTPVTPTTTPATTVSTRKTTPKPTRPTTQLTTTVEPSLQSTETFNGTTSQSTPETPATTPDTTVSTRKTTPKPTRPSIKLTTTVEPSLQSTETFNGTTSQSTPGEVTKTLPKDNSTSIDDGPSKTTIIVIVITAMVVIFGCFVTIYIYRVFFNSRKRPRCEDANSDTVHFTNDSPTTARVFVSRNGNTADRVCNHDETEVYAHYETIPDSIPNNIQSLYVNKTDEDHHGSSIPVNNESVYISKTPEAYYENVPDNIQSVYVNDTEEGHHESSAPVNHESVYVNKIREADYEDIPDNTQSVYANEGEEGRYEALARVKESVYVNKTPEGYYDDLVTDDLYIHPI